MVKGGPEGIFGHRVPEQRLVLNIGERMPADRTNVREMRGLAPVGGSLLEFEPSFVRCGDHFVKFDFINEQAAPISEDTL